MKIETLIQELKEILRSEDTPELSDAELIKACLLQNVSYRLPDSAKTDRLIGLRTLMRLWKRISQPHTVLTEPKGNAQVLLLNANQKKASSIMSYIAHESGNLPGHCIGKEELPIVGQDLGTSDKIRLLLFGIECALKCFWKSDRQNRSLFPLAVFESQQLLQFVEGQKIKHIYDFGPYLIDANWSTHLCMEQGVKVTRIPSSGPLKTHNQFALGNEMVLSTPYQFEEVELFKSTIRVNDFPKWIPEHALNYLDFYLAGPPEPEQGTIGYYSHAGWVRQSEGHTDDALRIPEAEIQLLKDLRSLLERTPELSLTIFLHPREKKTELQEAMESHYSTYLQGVQYAFADPKVPSALAFHTVDVGVAAFSTILYERLFCGYKTCIGNYFMNDFPMKGSSLERVCFSSEERMQSQLNKFVSISRAEFFQTNQIEGFRMDDFPSVQKSLASK
jgi:hypothetical protein